MKLGPRLTFIIVGGAVGAVGGVLIALLVGGGCLLFGPVECQRIGMLGFLSIFVPAGVFAGIIEWWWRFNAD